MSVMEQDSDPQRSLPIDECDNFAGNEGGSLEPPDAIGISIELTNPIWKKIFGWIKDKMKGEDAP